MTIKELLEPLSTLDQYEVLQRADVLFDQRWEPLGPRGGSLRDKWSPMRYYGGPLRPSDIETLTLKKPERQNKA